MNRKEGTGRRTLPQALILSAGFCFFAPTPVPARAGEPTVRIDRALFDKLDESINKGNGFKDGLGGTLAWAESYIMLSYVEMYRATRDRHYLDKLVDHADHVLNQRDDRRDFRDCSGRSRPAWSVGGKYTVAELLLKDRAGRAALKLRSTKYAYNDQTTVKCSPRGATGSFDLVIDNPYWKAREEYKALTMDSASPDFVERRVNARKWVAVERKVQGSEQGSDLVTVEVPDRSAGPPAADSDGKPLADRGMALIPLVMAYHGYSGQCTFPMLEFAWEVRRDPDLRAKYGAKADTYVAASVEVFRDADAEWRDGPNGGEGHYVFGEKGCAFWSDNVEKPFNYLCSEGRSLLRLAQLTGDAHWQSRAKAIAKLFRRHLRVADNGSFVWNYWWGCIEQGWDRDHSPSFNTPTYAGHATVEDSSHGHLDVAFAILCAEVGWVFNEADMRRFAGTFLKNVVDSSKWTMNDRVDGKGGWGNHNAMAAGWIDLAAWDPAVATAARRIYERQGVCQGSAGTVMLGVARLLKWDSRNRQ